MVAAAARTLGVPEILDPEIVTRMWSSWSYPDDSIEAALHWAADRLVQERRVTWVGLRLAHITAAVIASGVVMIGVVLSATVTVGVLLGMLLVGTALFLTVYATDSKIYKEILVADKIGLGVRSLGGFKQFPVAVMPALANSADGLGQRFDQWLADQQLKPAHTETFVSLACEFEGSFGELVTVSRYLA